jgi:hypothetical protein
VTGSGFGRAKPLLGFVSVTWLGIKAAVFFPFWRRWWLKHVGSTLVRLVFMAYCFQVGVVAHYLAHQTRVDGPSPSSPNDEDCQGPGFALLTGTEVVSCIILMISLSVLHAHMTSTQRQPSNPVAFGSESSSSTHSSASSSAFWAGQAANGGVPTSYKKQARTHKMAGASGPRWRRAMSEDPSFKPRVLVPPMQQQKRHSPLGKQAEEAPKESFSGDEEEDEVDENGAGLLKRTGSKKLKVPSTYCKAQQTTYVK